jgi:hypothetical protein
VLCGAGMVAGGTKKQPRSTVTKQYGQISHVTQCGVCAQ